MGNIFNIAFYQPIWNAMVLIYQYLAFHDFGVTIIILTLLVRLLLAPLSYKNAKDQAIIQRLNPKIQEIQKEHKDDKSKQAERVMELYKEHRVNPMMTFVYLFVQVVIFLNLYRVFQDGMKPDYNSLYSFVPNPGVLNYHFLGLFDLTKISWPLIIITAIVQFVLGKISLPPQSTMNQQTKTMSNVMLFIAPLMTIFVLGFLPSAIAIYWLITSAFSAIQQILINKSLNKNGGIAKLS